jgi:hypothetical protein
MTKSTEDAFQLFHQRLTPSKSETEAAKNHRASIEACLKSNFGLVRFFRTGSFGNGTSISSFSDVDYFASLSPSEFTSNSFTILSKVRDTLDRRFPNTGVKVRTPAVVVPFGTDSSETTEVVPAKYVEAKSGFNVYEIADGNGGWMRSSPEAHNSYVTQVNDKMGGKAKPLVRFIKAWKCYKNVPISSFYLELVVARYASEQNTILYYWDVHRIFKHLGDNRLSAIQDPMHVSGYISPCASSAQRDDALSKLSTAYTRADKAFEAQQAGKIKEAFFWWDLLFDGKFPAYG